MKRIIMAAVAGVALALVSAAPAGAVTSSDSRATKLLVSQGMPAQLAAKVAADPATVVRGGKVYVEGVESGAAVSAAEDAVQRVEQLAASSVVVSAAKGSDYWYGVAINSLGQPKTVVYLRYSWSWMWFLKQHYGTVSALTAAACGFLPGALAGGCGVLMAAYYAYTKSKIDEAIRLKKCLRIRFPAPPLADSSLFRWDLVTCRV
jgi:Na+-translocating ferredoxin:NAD+ oxidoreductase RnfG subunit